MQNLLSFLSKSHRQFNARHQSSVLKNQTLFHTSKLSLSSLSLTFEDKLFLSVLLFVSSLSFSLNETHTLSQWQAPTISIRQVLFSWDFLSVIHTCSHTLYHSLHPLGNSIVTYTLKQSIFKVKCTIFIFLQVSSVTRWFDYFFNSWPFTTMETCPIALKFCLSSFKILQFTD